MNSWLLSICSVILITTISSLILPEGKTGKFIKSIFAFITFFVIISPIVNVNYDFSFDFISSSEPQIENNYLDYVFNKRNEIYEENVIKLANEYFTNNYVEILYENNENVYTIKKVMINSSGEVIISDKEHIDIIEELKEKITKILNINKNLITINYEFK